MKNLLCLSLILFSGFELLAQNPSSDPLSAILNRSYFSFSAQIGGNKGLTYLDSGTVSLNSQRDATFSGEISYHYALSARSALTGSYAIGALPYSMYNPEFTQRGWSSYISSQRFGLGYSYRMVHSAKSFSGFNIGYALLLPQQMGIGIGSGSQSNDSTFSTKWEAQRLSGFAYEELGQLISVGYEYNRLLPNFDLIGFKLGYRKGFKDAVIFDYKAYDRNGNYGTGRYINQGTEFYAGISYAMTNYKKNEVKNTLAKADKREALKNRKKELEKYRSNSLKIEAGVASNFFKERFQDQRINVNTLSGPGLTLYTDLAIEQPDYSIHMGLQYHEIWETNKVRGQQWYGSSGVDYAAQINFGLGKSITNRAKTKRLVTVVGSVGLIGSSFSESRGTSGYGDTLLVISENNGGVRISPVLTLAANSSLRLYNQLYFNYGVQMSQGFLPVSRSSINYELTQSDNWSTNKVMNGSSLLLKFGLAFHLNNGL